MQLLTVEQTVLRLLWATGACGLPAPQQWLLHAGRTLLPAVSAAAAAQGQPTCSAPAHTSRTHGVLGHSHAAAYSSDSSSSSTSHGGVDEALRVLDAAAATAAAAVASGAGHLSKEISSAAKASAEHIAAAVPAITAHTPAKTETAAAAAAAVASEAAESATYAELAASVFKATEDVLGPLSLADLVFGLQAVAKQHREKELYYSIQGTPVSTDRQLLSQLLDAADLAYAAYKINPQSVCAVSHLRLHNLRKFVPHNSRLRPAYFIAVDHSQRTIIWAIRGTKNVSDIITDISGSSHALDGGRVHWGMLQAAQALLREEMRHLSRLSGVLPGYSIHLVGHSLGAAVAAVTTYLINTRPALRRQLRSCPAITATVIAPPPVFSKGLAAASERYTTSLIFCHDPVPRLTPAAVQRLRAELLQVDWAGQLKSRLLEAEYTQAIMSAINSASASTAQAAAQLQTLATELLQSRHIQQLTSALNGVVYGRQAGIVAHAAAAGSHGSNGSDAAAMANRWYQQQQAFEEEQQQAGWQQQLQAWQEQQQQQAEGESGQFAATEQQQQQLQAWQADVIRSWVDDVSGKLLPFVQGIKLPDADISRVAEAAVNSLNNSLRAVAFGIQGSSGGSNTTTTTTTTSSSSRSSGRQDAVTVSQDSDNSSSSSDGDVPTVDSVQSNRGSAVGDALQGASSFAAGVSQVKDLLLPHGAEPPAHTQTNISNSSGSSSRSGSSGSWLEAAVVAPRTPTANSSITSGASNSGSSGSSSRTAPWLDLTTSLQETAGQVLTTIRNAGQLIVSAGSGNSSSSSSSSSSQSSSSQSSSSGGGGGNGGNKTPAWLDLPDLQETAGKVLSTIRSAGQLLISAGGSTSIESSSSSSSGSTAGGASIFSRLPATPEAMLQFWRTRQQQGSQQQQQHEQQLALGQAGSNGSNGGSRHSLPGPLDVLLGPSDSASNSSSGSLGDHAEAAMAATAAAAAEAAAAMPTAAAEAVAAVRSAAGMASQQPGTAEAVASTAAASAAAAAAAAAATVTAETVTNMYPPGRLLFLMRYDLVQRDGQLEPSMQPSQPPGQQQQNQDEDMAGFDTTEGGARDDSSGSTSSSSNASIGRHHAPLHSSHSAGNIGGGGSRGHFGKARASAVAVLSQQGSRRQPLKGFGDLSPSSADFYYQQNVQQQPDGDEHSSDSRSRDSSSSSSSGSSSSSMALDDAGGSSGHWSKSQYVLLQAEREGNFESLVLHPDMFSDHRTRSYRAALLDMLRRAG